MFFDSWFGLLRVVVTGTATYAALICMLRISGKRTLSKMNAFDLVVTVALGSTLATVLLDNSVPLAEGVLALALLVFLQFVITWLSVRVELVRRLIKSDATALVRDGAYLEDAMCEQRVTRDEIEAAMRGHGVADLAQVSSVVLETDGLLSVLRKSETRSPRRRGDTL
jgi:uncharacterized membrane protein YcaP (DUF421 family)